MEKGLYASETVSVIGTRLPGLEDFILLFSIVSLSRLAENGIDIGNQLKCVLDKSRHF